MLRISSMLIGCMLILLIACSKSDSTSTPNNSCGSVSFASDVNPIIQSTCASSGCHNAGSTNGVGPLTNYQQVYNARTSVHSSVSSGSMPKNMTLTAAQKNAILCWINNGAPNN